MTGGVPGTPAPGGPGRPMPVAPAAPASAVPAPGAPAPATDDEAPTTPADAPDTPAAHRAETIALSRPGWPPPEPLAPADDWPAYPQLFGQAPYVRDPADGRLLDLMRAASAAAPELRRPPLGPALAAGRVDAEAVKALQAMLAARGLDLGPAGADGKFGPKTHAALTAFFEGAEPGADEPTGATTITDTRFDPAYKLGNSPPAGYRAFRGPVPSEVGQMARQLLGKPFGTETYFEAGGRRYVARNEPHYHPPGFKGGPNGWHQGVTVYEAS